MLCMPMYILFSCVILFCFDIGKTSSYWLSNKMFEFEFIKLY